MKLQLEIVSNEMIKPSTPTPDHLNNYKFSRLDQDYQLNYVPQVLFYQPSPSFKNGCTDHMTIVTRLKQSLSQSLSLFYPFAGRLTSDQSGIECNDKGVSFVVARALGCSIMDFLETTNRVDLVGHFLPKTIYDDDNNNNNNNNNNNSGGVVEVPPPLNVTTLIPFTIQVTIFDCGGFVISFQSLHKTCDGISWGNFLKTWASFATDHCGENVVIPDLETAFSLFPPCSEDIQPAGSKVRTLVPLDDSEAAAQVVDDFGIVKAFAFSSQAIRDLQVKGASDAVQYPTRVEAVSGFIWKHLISAAVMARPSSSTSGTFALTHAVNIRPRFDPPLPPSTFGNMMVATMAHYEGHILVGEKEPNLQDLVCRIRKSLSVMKNSEFVNKFQGRDGDETLSNYKHKCSELLGNPSVITHRFTSWCGPDMNPDFGFGAPIWAGFTGGKISSSVKNVIILMETCSSGIEAWFILGEQEMVILEDDQDFLQFASPSVGKLPSQGC